MVKKRGTTKFAQARKIKNQDLKVGGAGGRWWRKERNVKSKKKEKNEKNE